MLEAARQETPQTPATHYDTSGASSSNPAPQPWNPPRDAPPEARMEHSVPHEQCGHHIPTSRVSSLAMSGGNRAGDLADLDRFMQHLTSTLFHGDDRGSSDLWYRLQGLMEDGAVDVSWCSTKANRWVAVTCRACGGYVKVSHGTSNCNAGSLPAARSELLGWFQPAIVISGPRAV